MADVNKRADMMGSRADMISMRIDEVSRNQIWREHLIKESKLEGPQTPFQFNPKGVSTVTVKPTKIDPRSFGQEAQANQQSEIEKKIRENSRPLQEKYDQPMTSTQEIGWMHAQAWANGRHKISKTWYRGKGTSDVTRFADAYCTMSGSSPFADKSTR